MLFLFCNHLLAMSTLLFTRLLRCSAQYQNNSGIQTFIRDLALRNQYELPSSHNSAKSPCLQLWSPGAALQEQINGHSLALVILSLQVPIPERTVEQGKASGHSEPCPCQQRPNNQPTFCICNRTVGKKANKTSLCCKMPLPK